MSEYCFFPFSVPLAGEIISVSGMWGITPNGWRLGAGLFCSFYFVKYRKFKLYHHTSREGRRAKKTCAKVRLCEAVFHCLTNL